MVQRLAALQPPRVYVLSARGDHAYASRYNSAGGAACFLTTTVYTYCCKVGAPASCAGVAGGALRPGMPASAASAAGGSSSSLWPCARPDPLDSRSTQKRYVALRWQGSSYDTHG